MASKIQWTDDTWNPWHGCQKVSPGCKFCYMHRDKDRFKKDGSVLLRSGDAIFNKPLKTKEPTLFFTCSFSDWFEPRADEFRAQAWKIIKNTPQHTYQILTKRPERILEHLPADWGNGYPNVWLGVSVENQEYANIRIPLLVKVPAVVRFLSVEPLLEAIDFNQVINKPKNSLLFFGFGAIGNRNEYKTYTNEVLQSERQKAIHWVIVGGESGNTNGKWLYRPTELDWIRDIVDYCKRGQVPVFVKQLGSHLAKVGKLKDRFGGDMLEFPLSLQVREYPVVYQAIEK